MIEQYDLFGEIEAAEHVAQEAAGDRSTQAAAFLSSGAWGRLLGWWLHPAVIEARIDHGEIKASYHARATDIPGWAFAVRPDGLRFELGDTWRGWHHRPCYRIPWAELHALRNAHPDVTVDLARLAEGHGQPCSAGWRWWLLPYSLDEGGIHHPSHIEHEQSPDYYDHDDRPQDAYADRVAAWRLVTQTTALSRLSVDDAA